jgi:16S rRNA (cytidine1402-2'-O)-methyltransferase
MAGEPGRGRLVLIATPIGNLEDLSARARGELGAADVVACEDTRRTGQLFAHFQIDHAPFIVCNEHTEAAAAAEIRARLDSGATVALVSDAGMPAISDPGARVVRAAVEAGHDVTAVPGPSAVSMAVAISGLAEDRFVFEGFLPRKGSARRERIDELATEKRPSVLFEAPHRLERTISDLAARLTSGRRIAIARELTKRHEDVWRGTLSDAREHLTAAPPRGEYVLVLEGAPSAEVSDAELEFALRTELRSGASRRAAVDTVSAGYEVARRRVYALALALA